jgi:hypothetical protein
MKPVLTVVNDDAELRALLERDLRQRFGGHYDIEAHADAEAALGSLRRHADDGRPVAAVFSVDTAPCGGSAFREPSRRLRRR